MYMYIIHAQNELVNTMHIGSKRNKFRVRVEISSIDCT